MDLILKLVLFLFLCCVIIYVCYTVIVPKTSLWDDFSPKGGKKDEEDSDV